MIEGLELNLPETLPAKIITCTVEGALEVEDIQGLLTISEASSSGPATSLAPTFEGKDLKVLRERHHMAARLLASGMQQTLVCQLTGYTDSYLSTMKKAPAMQELIGFYSAKYENAAAAITERLRHAGLSAVEKLMERIDVEGENALNANELLGLAKLGLDRGGHGPTSTQNQNNTDHIIDHAELRRIELAAKKGSREYIETVPSLPAPETSNEDS